MIDSQVSSLLIFTFFTGKDRWIGLIILFVYPKLLEYLKTIYTMIERWWYPKTFSVTLDKTKNKDGEYTENISYDAMCWYCIDKYCSKQSGLVAKSDITKYNEKIGISYRRVPKYNPINSITVQYTIPIKLKFLSDSIILTGSNILHITNFVSHVNDLFIDYTYNDLDNAKLYICEWKDNKSSMREGKYEGVVMNINKTYDNVYLPKSLLDGIRLDISNFLGNEEFYANNGIPYKRGYLFYGPPGTGKSSMAYAISRENKMNLYKFKCKNNKDNIRIRAKLIPPGSVVLIEEIDTQVYNDRIDTSIFLDAPKLKERKGKVSLSSLMEVLDGYDTFHGCIVILTTNHKEYLDDALIRPGRVDMHYLFDIMTAEDIQLTIKRFTGFNITVSELLSMSSSTLINQILLPNKDNIKAIQELIDNATFTHMD